MNKFSSMPHLPGWRGVVLAAAVSITMGAGSGCAFLGSGAETETGEEIPVPDDDGIYADQGDDLVRLDGDLEWEQETWDQRSNLAPDTVFVIQDPAIEDATRPLEQMVGLRKVAWVRSQISDQGAITPVTGTSWRAVGVPELEVNLDYARPEDSHENLLQVRPVEPLEPGLYSIFLDAGEDSRKARFGVGWPELDKQAYAASVCVDHYVDQGDAHRPCREQTAGGSTESLQIHLVKPETRTTGSGRSLVVSGVILNNSSDVQEVPVLTGELRNADEEVITRWRFRAASNRLEPGQSTSFRSEVSGVPEQIHSVHVDFDTMPQANTN